MIKENIETINALVIKPMYENGEFSLELADEISRAIYKQIPTKVIKKTWWPSKCPMCEAELSENLGDGFYKDWDNIKTCDCGQKLDWSDDDD